MSSPTKVLTARDINTSGPSPKKVEADAASAMNEKEGANKLRSMEYHRQVLQSRLEEDKSEQVYISPSDMIQSPCTAKLSKYKNQRFARVNYRVNPQSLFAGASKKAGITKLHEDKESTNGGPILDTDEDKESKDGSP